MERGRGAPAPGVVSAAAEGESQSLLGQPVVRLRLEIRVREYPVISERARARGGG